MADAPCMGDNATFKHEVFCPVDMDRNPHKFLPDIFVQDRSRKFFKVIL